MEFCLSTLEVGGPLLRGPVLGVVVTVKHILIGNISQIPTSLEDLHNRREKYDSKCYFTKSGYHAALALIKSCLNRALFDALNKFSDWILLEPMMFVQLNIPMDSGTFF